MSGVKLYVIIDGDLIPIETRNALKLLWKLGVQKIVSFFKDIISGESVERGLLVFDVMEADGDIPFAIKEHMERFYRALDFCKIKSAIGKKSLEAHIKTALKDANFTKSLIRVDVVLFGEGVELAPIVIIKVKSFLGSHPLKLKTYRYYRNMPNVKLAGGYAQAQVIRRQYPGYDDVLYIHPSVDVFTETSRGNFFAVKYDGDKSIIYGVAPSEYILPGLTRSFIIDILYDHEDNEFEGNLIFAGALPVSELSCMDEVFVASSGVRVSPVKRIDDMTFDIGEDEKGGKITRMIGDFFDRFVEDSYATHRKR